MTGHQPAQVDDGLADDRQLDAITRTGDALLDAVIAFGEHAFQQGRAVAVGDLDRARAEHRAVIDLLGEVQRLRQASVSSANAGVPRPRP